MTRYTDSELQELLDTPESFHAERKASWSGDVSKKAQEAICAFANDLPGSGKAGVLFVGANDDGTASGLAITDELLLALTSIKTDGNIVPPPSLTAEKRTLRGHDLAVVTVEPSDSPPVRYRGRIWIRSGPRRGQATAQDERILNEKRRFGDRPFDARPIHGATLANLNLRKFEEEYLPSTVAPDVLEANERSLEEKLAATKMVMDAADPIPTGLGILVLCPKPEDFLPGAYVQFLRVDGTELSDPITDELQITGAIDDVIRRAEEKFQAHNRTQVDFTSSDLEKRVSTYPAAALQQVLRNAILHRTYEATNAPVRAHWFNDRVEISSPGGPFGQVTELNFGEPGLADYRNPSLAGAMRSLGFVQRFGAGIAISKRALLENGNPPMEFRIDAGHVSIAIRCIPKTANGSKDPA